MPKISAATIAEHRTQTRERILAAVAELTRTHGIDAISMTDVAVAADITRTALYNYFPDKPALLLAFTETVTSHFMDRYEQELPTDASAAVRLEIFIRLQLEGIIEHPHPAAGELSASLGPDAYRALADHVEPMQRLLADILSAGAESGEFDVDDPEGTAKLTMALVGSQRLPLMHGETSLEAAHRLVASFALRALGAS